MAIGRLEAFGTDYQRKKAAPLPVVPAPAATASRSSAPVRRGSPSPKSWRSTATRTIYDAWPEPGGVLLYGIPDFKLRKRSSTDKID